MRRQNYRSVIHRHGRGLEGIVVHYANLFTADLDFRHSPTRRPSRSKRRIQPNLIINRLYQLRQQRQRVQHLTHRPRKIRLRPRTTRQSHPPLQLHRQPLQPDRRLRLLLHILHGHHLGRPDVESRAV